MVGVGTCLTILYEASLLTLESAELTHVERGRMMNKKKSNLSFPVYFYVNNIVRAVQLAYFLRMSYLAHPLRPYQKDSLYVIPSEA